MQKRSSISRARYLVAILALLAAGCGGDDAPPGPIPVDGEPIAKGAYTKPLGAAVAAKPALEDADYRERLISRFTSITPENAMKWAIVHPTRDEFDFDEADKLMAFARRSGKRVRGHPLVWDEQLPAWLEEGDWSADELKRVMRRHIRALVRRYRGRIDEWDVVNEPLSEAGGFEENIFYETLGPGWVPYAFRVAHRADPGAKLFLNETDAEVPGPKSRGLFALARHLKRRGVPIDGIGFQHHTTGRDAPTRARLRDQFRRAQRLGLSAAITEMDVGATKPRAQARLYADAARVCVDAPNCTGLTIWGVTDRWSWLEAEARALPYDEDGRPKPALRALLEPFLKVSDTFRKR